MTKKQLAIVASFLVHSGLTGASLVHAKWSETYWRHRYWTEMTDIAQLISGYGTARQQTGKWPEPGTVYTAFSTLQNSTQALGARTDSYRISPNGPWYQIELRDDGQIYASVTIWEERAAN